MFRNCTISNQDILLTKLTKFEVKVIKKVDTVRIFNAIHPSENFCVE